MISNTCGHISIVPLMTSKYEKYLLGVCMLLAGYCIRYPDEEASKTVLWEPTEGNGEKGEKSHISICFENGQPDPCPPTSYQNAMLEIFRLKGVQPKKYACLSKSNRKPKLHNSKVRLKSGKNNNNTEVNLVGRRS